jgi:membrane protein DedA with SNARE-associated domain
VGIPWLDALAGSWWIYPALYVLVVADAFLVVIPGEIAVAALGALAIATDPAALWILVPVAALGALTGDLACYAIGRAVGLDRWRWQREGRTGAAIERIRGTVDRRTAVLIFTARYIPFARIAVNLCIGAARLPLARYLPVAAAAGLAWALFQVGIGTALGAVFRGQPILALVSSVVAALLVGLTTDRIVAVARATRRGRTRGRLGGEHPDEGHGSGDRGRGGAEGLESVTEEGADHGVEGLHDDHRGGDRREKPHGADEERRHRDRE